MKQETLEEVAENSFLANKLKNSTAVEKAYYIAGFRESAKWQQERSYSEEEVENILIEYVKTNPTKPYRVISWFTQFKKK